MTAFFNRLPRCLGLMVTVAVLAVLGCSGDRTVTIRGTVTCQGQPLRSGVVALHGPEGAYAAGPIQADGSFVVTGVAPGEVKVAIREVRAGSKAPVAEGPPVPEKYRDPEKSELRYTITPATTKLDIELK